MVVSLGDIGTLWPALGPFFLHLVFYQNVENRVLLFLFYQEVVGFTGSFFHLGLAGPDWHGCKLFSFLLSFGGWEEVSNSPTVGSILGILSQQPIDELPQLNGILHRNLFGLLRNDHIAETHQIICREWWL